jgi:hypothetical protein
MRDELTKEIIQTMKAAEDETAEPFQRPNISDEQPTVADLVLPGTGYKFSDEFACFLRVLGGESA